jgi:hypothetical protein
MTTATGVPGQQRLPASGPRLMAARDQVRDPAVEAASVGVDRLGVVVCADLGV